MILFHSCFPVYFIICNPARQCVLRTARMIFSNDAIVAY
ncbi:hypothetical protein Mettu_0855 [Methylobacter tundripaludum SV96]|uniref:Uncharacterized protein n=1 Tax=Methylobacter tundripaludum (strain ATCC BAA-1195 / DSM 17260 / SV96) TaxID=697282 RepID=G3IQH1_METTV|nr:hypothetical protein Mettu_0855 [Methylobacter tundripaludum SV96]